MSDISLQNPAGAGDVHVHIYITFEREHICKLHTMKFLHMHFLRCAICESRHAIRHEIYGNLQDHIHVRGI